MMCERRTDWTSSTLAWNHELSRFGRSAARVGVCVDVPGLEGGGSPPCPHVAGRRSGARKTSNDAAEALIVKLADGWAHLAAREGSPRPPSGLSIRFISSPVRDGAQRIEKCGSPQRPGRARLALRVLRGTLDHSPVEELERIERPKARGRAFRERIASPPCPVPLERPSEDVVPSIDGRSRAARLANGARRREA